MSLGKIKIKLYKIHTFLEKMKIHNDNIFVPGMVTELLSIKTAKFTKYKIKYWNIS